MEGASYKLLKHVEGYVVHSGHTVGKFVMSPLQEDNAVVAFDAQQLLESMFCSTEGGMELLRDVLQQCNHLHEETAGPANRVSFIAYVTLHTYHALAKDTSSAHIGKNDFTSQFEVCEEFDRNLERVEVLKGEGICKESVWVLMKHFVERLRVEGYTVDPIAVLKEVAIELQESTEGYDVYSNISSPVLLGYLCRSFCHTPLSWEYEAARLAVDCFLFIHLFITAVPVKTRTSEAIHKLVDRMIFKVSHEGGNDEWLAERKGCVLPGVALTTTLRFCKNYDAETYSSFISPIQKYEALLQDEGHHVDLLLLFSRCAEDTDSALERLTTLVDSVQNGVVVILIQEYTKQAVLRRMESWGNEHRIVVVASSIGESSMLQFSLAFSILPRTLGSHRVDSGRGILRIKSVFSRNKFQFLHGMRIQKVLIALEPTLSRVKSMGQVPNSLVSVFFGGSCLAVCSLMERCFDRQVHHLVNILCLPPPLNSMMPGGGAAESYAVSYLDKLISQQESQSEGGLFMKRLMTALKNAITAYLELVLQSSFGFRVEEAIEHLTLSRQRFDAVMHGGTNGNEMRFKGMTVTSSENCKSTLYTDGIPLPPLIVGSSPTRQQTRSTILPADIFEWEAQVEVTSAFLSIGRCLDTLCFSSILTKCSLAGEGMGEPEKELVFNPDIVFS